MIYTSELMNPTARKNSMDNVSYESTALYIPSSYQSSQVKLKDIGSTFKQEEYIRMYEAHTF